MDFLPSQEFRRCVDRYNGNYKLQRFSCWDQFLCMAFAQLTYRESLRDIEACLRSAGTKLYHMGIRSRVARNTLANANQVRDWRIYADFGQILIAIARQLYIGDSFAIDRLCTGFDDGRFVLIAVPMGQVPQARQRNQNPHGAGPARQHSFGCPGNPRQSSRPLSSPSTRLRTRFVLHHGPRLSGFRTAARNQSGRRILRYEPRVISFSTGSTRWMSTNRVAYAAIRSLPSAAS